MLEENRREDDIRTVNDSMTDVGKQLLQDLPTRETELPVHANDLGPFLESVVGRLAHHVRNGPSPELNRLVRGEGAFPLRSRNTPTARHKFVGDRLHDAAKDKDLQLRYARWFRRNYDAPMQEAHARSHQLGQSSTTEPDEAARHQQLAQAMAPFVEGLPTTQEWADLGRSLLESANHLVHRPSATNDWAKHMGDKLRQIRESHNLHSRNANTNMMNDFTPELREQLQPLALSLDPDERHMHAQHVAEYNRDLFADPTVYTHPEEEQWLARAHWLPTS